MKHVTPQLIRGAILFALFAVGKVGLLRAEDAPMVIPLWANGAPGFESRKDLPETKSGNNIAGINNPSLTVFLPETGHATGAAVVVLPGGGHKFLVVGKEGTSIAQWLAAHGIAGFVLKYRLAKETGSPYRVEVESLQDTQRAIRLIRSRAKEWGVDPAKIGAMGFSAGAELAALVSLRNDAGNPAAIDPIDRESCRPAFQALIYPGGIADKVPVKDSPPAFLACGYDDRPDISEGVPELYLRFKKVGVPAEMHVYAGVGHGFALRPGPSAGWAPRFADWLAEIFLPRPAPVAKKTPAAAG